MRWADARVREAEAALAGLEIAVKASRDPDAHADLYGEAQALRAELKVLAGVQRAIGRAADRAAKEAQG